MANTARKIAKEIKTTNRHKTKVINNIGKKRKEANSQGFRSALEMGISERLKKARIPFSYEPKDNLLSYTIKENSCKCYQCGSTDIHSTHTYLIDFLVKDIVVEAKGVFTPSDRKKMLAVRETNPQYTYVIILQAPNKKITKKTTYKDWCDKNNFISCSVKDNFEKIIKDLCRK